MSTIDTSTWNPDPALNESIGDIPLNESASIAQTWQAIQMLMAAGGLHGLQLVTFDGATASADGKQGLVPAPEAGDQDKFLKGDGTWGEVGDVSGNAGTATKLSTARTISLTGDVSGSASFDGSANVSITATVADDSHNHVISNVDGLQTALNGKAADSDVMHLSGTENIAGSKTFSSTINGSVSGNAGTAAKLQTAQSLKTKLDSTTAVTFDGSDAQDAIPVTGVLPILNGGTGSSTKNFVDLTTDQNVSGIKTFLNDIAISHAWRNSINIKSSSYTITGAKPTYSACTVLTHSDSADNKVGEITIYHSSGGNAFIGLVVKTVAASPETLEVRLYNNFANTIKAFRPETSDLISLGSSGNLWKEVFAASTAISTSDERLKTAVEAVDDDVLDAWEDVPWHLFQFKDAVAQKGQSARIHAGLVAQRIAKVFEDHGLDASRYGFFCHDSWQAEPEERDEFGKIVTQAREAGDAYALRYEEALCIEAAYQRRRADRAEARIADLEKRIATLEEKLNG